MPAPSQNDGRFGASLHAPYKKIVYPLCGVLLVFFLSGLFFYAGAVRPPSRFTAPSSVTISKGTTLSEASNYLAEQGLVRSAFWFKIFVHLRGEGGRIIAGDYFFRTPQNAWKIAAMLNSGESGFTPERVTLREGATIDEMASVLASKLPVFDEEEFKRLARSKEGYLFPDTYFFFPNEKPEDILKKLENNFIAKVKGAKDILDASGKPVRDIIILASILEKEAAVTEDRRKIAGILWKRLSIGMPLQVDAAFLYLNGKNTYELTEEDLAIDSPYNTYRNRGLPPTPIGNPGLDAILSAATPIETDYLYYLSDRSGIVYYSETFEEHKQKKELHVL